MGRRSNHGCRRIPFPKNLDLNFVAENWEKKLAGYPTFKAEWEARELAAAQAAADAKVKGLPYKKKWNPEPPKPDGSPHYTKPSALYNGMIAPLVPTALAGILWYQGESNIGRADQYRLLFPSLITGWRNVFGNPNLPFYWVQLPNFNGFGPDQIARLRESQDYSLSLPATRQAITIDVGETDNIHPLNKQDVGHRLALIALEKNYGKKVISSAPAFFKATFDRDAAEISFTDNEDGLTMKGSALTGFELAGEDQKFQPAEAILEGGKVKVSSASVPRPVTVRYAWTNAPAASLFGKTGLPVAPFRSDKW